MPLRTYPPIEQVQTASSQLNQYLSSTTCNPTGTLTVTDVMQRVTQFKYSTAQGMVTPGWRKMRNSGAILPMTLWDQYTIEGQASLGTRKWCNSAGKPYEWVSYRTGITGPLPWVDDPRWKRSRLEELIASDLDLAYYVQKSASKIYSSGYDALTFLAELKQLQRMFVGLLDKFLNLLRKRRPGELESLWLEGRYGWRTLMYDIQDFSDALNHVNARRTRYRQTTGQQFSGMWTESLTYAPSDTLLLEETTYSWVVNQRGTVVADIDIPDFQFNPFTTWWEVTKLSFVFDWLFHVGQALESASFLLKAKDYKSCGGFRADFSISGTQTLVSKNSNRSASNNAAWEGSATLTKRVPMTVSLLPQIKLTLDPFKVIDLLMLIAQQLRK